LSAAFAVWRLQAAGWQPVALAELGTRYAQIEPSGSEGYDGQFTYYVAMDPRPEAVAPHLDVPAYRYQRILYPLLARALALGQPAWIPWSLILISLIAQAVGTWAVASFLADHGVWPG
jgi:hypothetical protein